MIQDILASDLGLKFGQNESKFDRARRLHNRLKKGKRQVLVILDNIWAKPDLEAIGVPYRDNRKESALCIGDYKEINGDDQGMYKILLTSRSKDL